MAVATKFREYLSPGGSSKGERKLVQKLDFFILTFCCLMYFLNYVSLLRSSIYTFSADMYLA
jgi:ACS family pantothenate transporter-like MFS transporter